MAIAGLLVSVFAGSSRGRSAPSPASTTVPSPASTAVPGPVRDSCLTFDRATGRLAAKDSKGFIDAMATAATAAQSAASTDRQWEPLVAGFAAFANDLAANNAQKVFNDLDSINQLCAVARGPRPLNLKGQGP